MANNSKYTRFDAADHLDDVGTHLEIALQGSVEDPTAIPRALGVIARSHNMSELARRVGMSRDGLYKALSADGNPTWSGSAYGTRSGDQFERAFRSTGRS